MSDNSPHLFDDILQYALAGGAGVLGHIMYHLHMVQKGERKPWWWVVCGMIIALGIGWTVLGLADWIGIPYKASQSFSIIAGWGGPRLLDSAVDAGLRKYLEAPEKADGVDPQP